MSEFHDPFAPHQVDESIEQLISANQPDTPLHGQMNSDARLIHSLQKYYSPEQQRYIQALQRVENRLIERVIPQNERSSTRSQPSLRQQQASRWWQTQQKGREQQMQERQPSMNRLATVSRYALILVVILLLVGSLTFILTYVQHRNSGFAGNPIKSAPTTTHTIPTPTLIPVPPIGTTLYTTSTNSTGYNGVSWSPDSKRIASSTVDGVQIWDAVDGQHLVNVPLAAPSEWPYALAWSPTSQLVAIATNKEIVVVNGQNGRIIYTHAATIAIAAAPHILPATSSYLGAHFSDSGGLGFCAVTWSPDGKSIAFAFSSGASGDVQIWNPEKDAIQLVLNVSTPYNIGALAWSSDGQYLAANTGNTQETDPTQPTDMVLAWNMSTHQVVFQQKASLTGSNTSISWQPRSHHLTFSVLNASGTTLEVWDIPAGTLVKRYTGMTVGTFGWSPDGKYLAYTSYQATGGSYGVTIMDTNTEKQIFVYKEHKNNVNFIVWSPNGKDILSAEGNNSGAMLVKVWVAE